MVMHMITGFLFLSWISNGFITYVLSLSQSAPYLAVDFSYMVSLNIIWIYYIYFNHIYALDFSITSINFRYYIDGFPIFLLYHGLFISMHLQLVMVLPAMNYMQYLSLLEILALISYLWISYTFSGLSTHKYHYLPIRELTGDLVNAWWLCI